MKNTAAEFEIGQKITIGRAYRMGGLRIADGWEGEWYVVGRCGKFDLMIAKHPEDDYAGIVHVNRTLESGRGVS